MGNLEVIESGTQRPSFPERNFPLEFPSLTGIEGELKVSSPVDSFDFSNLRTLGGVELESIEATGIQICSQHRNIFKSCFCINNFQGL